VVRIPGRRELADYAALLRQQGLSWVTIAEDVCGRYPLTPRSALRQIRGWSQREVADRWNERWPDEPKSDKIISYWERWPAPTGHEPPVRMLNRLAQLYECSIADLLADLPNHRHLDPHHDTAQAVRLPPVRVERDTAADSERRDEGEAMERRQLLQWAAAGLGTGALGLSGEPVRQLLSHTLAAQDNSLDDWQITIADHLHGLFTRPAAQVRDGLMADLYTLSGQIDRTSNPVVVTELRRVTARLSVLQAKALSRLGEHGAAIRWWETAGAAADAAGDRALGLAVRGSEAQAGLYGQRDPQAVLAMVERALREAGPRPSPGLANLTSAKARVLSMLGRHAEARRALNTLTEVSTSDVVSDHDFCWADQVYFTASWVNAAAGDEAAAGRARENVLRLGHASLSPSWNYLTNVQLHQAMCVIVNGGASEGAEHTIGVLDQVPGQFRTNQITQTAHMALNAVPRAERSRPAIEDLRHALGTP
jgi:transcriptional regulator with XRE-family HTH domain